MGVTAWAADFLGLGGALGLWCLIEIGLEQDGSSTGSSGRDSDGQISKRMKAVLGVVSRQVQEQTSIASLELDCDVLVAHGACR